MVSRPVLLRQRSTEAESRLWFAVRDRRQEGAKFRRQVPIGDFIVDFACLERRLIVEVDGGQHGGADDQARDEWLRAQGYRVLRFWNNDVLGNLDGVLQTISAALKEPSPAGGRGQGEGGLRGPRPTTLTPALSRQRERENLP